MAKGAIRLIFRLVYTLVLLPLLFLIEPFRKVRFTHMWTARFGSLAFINHQYVALRALDGADARTTRIWFGAKPANRQLFEMWARVLPVIESRWLSALYHYTQDITAKSRFFQPWPYDFLGFRETDFGPVLAFTAEEEARGRAALAEMGLGPDDWFVCFQSRDALFHQQRGEGDSGSHRNCAIETYLPAARHITAQGGVAIRMGSVVDRPLPETGEARIVDYATRHRSDFADIYLLGRCRFLLGCASGTESIPPLFKLPVAQANRAPIWPAMIGRQSLYIPKLIREIATGRLLHWDELQAFGAFTLDQNLADWIYPGNLEKLGIALVDNSADDILDLCRDMEDRLDGRLSTQDARLLNDYKRRYLSHLRGIEFAPDIGPRFLSRHAALFNL